MHIHRFKKVKLLFRILNSIQIIILTRYGIQPIFSFINIVYNFFDMELKVTVSYFFEFFNKINIETCVKLIHKMNGNFFVSISTTIFSFFNFKTSSIRCFHPFGNTDYISIQTRLTFKGAACPL